MIYKIEFSEEALKQIATLRKGDKNTYLKCFDLILAIAENPREGIGKPERLKGFGEREVYSRRVNDKDRLVYTVFDEPYYKVGIASCVGHYKDH